MRSDIANPRLGEADRRIQYAPVRAAAPAAETLTIAPEHDDRERSPFSTAAVRTADIATARLRIRANADAPISGMPGGNSIRPDDDAHGTIPGALLRPTLRPDPATHYADRIRGATRAEDHRACSRRGSERIATDDSPG